MARSLVGSLAILLVAALHPLQAQHVVPGDQLVIEGVPPIPASLADQVRRYTEYRSAGLRDWHPTERAMLIGTRFGNSQQIHLVKSPLGARTQLTFASEPVGGGSFEPKTGRYLLIAMDAGGNEFTQLFRQDLPSGEVTLLTDGRSQNGGVRWSRAGDQIAYSSTRRNGADRDLYTMDPAAPASDRLVLAVKGGGWGVADWSPDDRRWLVFEYISVTHSRLWEVEVATGAMSRLAPVGVPDTAAYAGARYSRDGSGVYLITDADAEFRRLAHLDLATKKLTPITESIAWDVDDFELSPDGKTLAFETNEGGVSRLHLMDTASRRVRAVPLPVGLLGGLRWHRSGREIGFTLTTARTASDVYSLDPRTLALTRWTESETGGLDTSKLPEPELIRWRSFDGREITGFYYRPPARFAGRRPVLISIHGGPEGQARPGFLGRNNFFLNELGLAIVYPNVRGSTGYGKTFVGLDNGMRREDAVRDIGGLLDWIATRPDLDAGRILVSGGSYGGYMTLAVATHYDARICCAIDVVGISNFVTFLTNTESYRRDLRRVEYGDERDPEMRAFMERIAPLNNASKITKPLFVVQGGNDPRVPRTEAEQMVARVKANGSPVWYLMARDEGHGFRKKSNADYQFYATVAFVRQFLLGESISAQP